MKRIRVGLAMAGIAIAASLGWAPIPVHADDGVIVETGAGPTAVRASELQASELSQLREAGLQGPELTIQRKQGLTLITDGQGGWIVTEDETPSTRAETRALSFGLGVCEGKFFLPKKVNANVEWGPMRHAPRWERRRCTRLDLSSSAYADWPLQHQPYAPVHGS